jgi:ATP-dependent RNA helicase RhlB
MTSTTFAALALAEPLAQAITEIGYTHLTDVQQSALPLTLAGKDIAAQGRTGTGKTATFLITAIQHILTNDAKKGRQASDPRVLIVAPTRELVIQIFDDARKLSAHSGIRLHAVYGGVDYKKQQSAFDDGVDILIGTPGRLIDFFKQKRYALKRTEMLVIDEADRMFDLGFISDVRFMMRRMPHWSERQSLLFSATLSYRVMELAYEHMNNPEKIRAEEGELTASNIHEVVYHTGMDEKKPLMVHLLRNMDVQRGMIFANEKRTGESLARFLAHYGFRVGILSGDVPQRKRMRILASFTKGDLQLLVATDVASRGIHVDDVSHVFNYDLPEDAESYVHRIGRTARAGASGTAVSFACERFCFALPDIEAMIERSLPVTTIPADALAIGEITHADARPEGLPSTGKATTRRPSKTKNSRRNSRNRSK